MAKYIFKDSKGQPPVLETGRYRVEILEAEIKFSNEGNEYINMRLEEASSGRTIYDSISLLESAAWKLDLVLKCMWPSRNWSKPPTDQEFDVDQNWCNQYLVGCHGECDVIKTPHRKNKEKLINEIEHYIIPGEEDAGPEKEAEPKPWRPDQ